MPRKAQPDTPELVTKDQAAEILGVTTKTIDRLVKRGELTPYRQIVGHNRVFFRRDEIERLKTPAPVK